MVRITRDFAMGLLYGTSLSSIWFCFYIVQNMPSPLEITVQSSIVSKPLCVDWRPQASKSKEDPWTSMKRTVKPAKCPVNGIPIEELDAAHNFRRAYELSFTGDVEDKAILLQYLRGGLDMSLRDSPRRVYLDLGGNHFSTSVTWILQNYPLDFTEVHVFEAVTGLFVIPEIKSRRWSVESMKRGLGFARADDPPNPTAHGGSIPDWQLERITLHNAFVGVEDGRMGGGRSVNITRFIKKELGMTAEDTLIVKMDVEGAEWTILEAWLSDPEMPHIVDELFVEVHYRDKSMAQFGWDNIKMTNGTAAPPREGAVRLFEDLRKAGFYAHAWP